MLKTAAVSDAAEEVEGCGGSAAGGPEL
ncbi:jg108, partial [Pararge aegeria aegeria]